MKVILKETGFRQVFRDNQASIDYIAYLMVEMKSYALDRTICDYTGNSMNRDTLGPVFN